MARVFMHCPLNISRTLVKMMEEFCQKWQEKYGIEVQIKMQPHQPGRGEPVPGVPESGRLLRMLTLGHVNDFADLGAGLPGAALRALPGRLSAETGAGGQGIHRYQGILSYLSNHSPSPCSTTATWSALRKRPEVAGNWRSRVGEAHPDAGRLAWYPSSSRHLWRLISGEFEGFSANATTRATRWRLSTPWTKDDTTSASPT
jgi:hypothetical protein